jgi:ADP-heptose:LPS heptosyltransferase
MSELSRQPPLDPTGVRRVLIIRPRFVGDVCLTLPVVDHVRRHAPHAAIDYLVEDTYAPLVDGDPRFARVVKAKRSNSISTAWQLLADLARSEYDLVLDLFCNPRTAIWTAATRASVRVGYPGKGWRSGRYNRFVYPTGKSAIAFHLTSINVLGWKVDWEAVPQLYVPERRCHLAAALVGELGVTPESRYVLLHPGAAWPTRRWEPDDFAAVAYRLVTETLDCSALILAGPGEEELAESVVERVSHPRCRLIAGVPLGDLPAVCAGASAFIGGDSGPIHVSVASGTPTVGIFGRNEPEMFFPYPPSLGHRAVYTGVWCSPCHRDVCSHLSCLRSISPETVWNALREILERRTPWPGARPALLEAL